MKGSKATVLHCVAGTLSSANISCFYWCLLFTTSSRHGKKPKTEMEVKRGNDKGNLVLMSLWGICFCFLMRIKATWQKMEIIIWSKNKIPLLTHSHPASPRLQHRWVISWISVHVLFDLLEILTFWEINVGQILWLILFLWCLLQIEKRTFLTCNLLLETSIYMFNFCHYSLLFVCSLMGFYSTFVFHPFVTKLNMIAI